MARLALTRAAPANGPPQPPTPPAFPCTRLSRPPSCRVPWLGRTNPHVQPFCMWQPRRLERRALTPRRLILLPCASPGQLPLPRCLPQVRHRQARECGGAGPGVCWRWYSGLPAALGGASARLRPAARPDGPPRRLALQHVQQRQVGGGWSGGVGGAEDAAGATQGCFNTKGCGARLRCWIRPAACRPACLLAVHTGLG